MDIIHRIARQPAKLLAAVQAVVGLALVAGWITLEDAETMVGALLLALSAILAAVSEYLTPIGDARLAEGTNVTLPDGASATVTRD